MIKLVKGWIEHFVSPKAWPDANMRDKVAYAKGTKKSGNIWLNKKSHWSNWPIIIFFVRSHERGHALWMKMTGTMPHSSDAFYPVVWYKSLWFVLTHLDSLCGLMAERGTLAWWLTPFVSLFRWSWWDSNTRLLIEECNDAE